MLQSPPDRTRIRALYPPGVVQFHQPGQDEASLPCSVEAEEAVLGSLLIDRDTVLSVAPVLKPEHFFSEERANLYQAILMLYSNSTPADLITVRDALKDMGALGEGEGQVKAATLFNLMHSTPSPVHVGYYLEIVLKHWLARQLIGECSSTVARAFLPALPIGDEEIISPAELLAQHSTRLQELATSLTTLQPGYFLSHEKSLDYTSRFDGEEIELIEPDKDDKDPWENSRPKPKRKPRLRLGWPAFDGIELRQPPVVSLLPATLTTVLGRTGGGKTIAAMQIADANAEAGLNVLYFHVELNQEQMLARRYCRLTGVPVLPQLLRQLNRHSKEQLHEAQSEVAGWAGRVDFVHCPNWGGEKLVQELKARHFALMASGLQGYDLIVLDYLQRLGRPEGAARTPEHEALAANVRTFSDALNELNIAGLMTSQVGRAGEAKHYEPPEVDEGLGSGDIERCSNQLIALAVSEDKTEVKYAVRKNTFGELGASGTLIYDAKRLQFL